MRENLILILIYIPNNSREFVATVANGDIKELNALKKRKLKMTKMLKRMDLNQNAFTVDHTTITARYAGNLKKMHIEDHQIG